MVFLNIYQRSAACDKLTAGWTSFGIEYDQLRTKFVNSTFSKAQVNTLLDTWSQQIREAILEASNTHDDAISVGKWENAIEKLKNQLEFARNN